MGTGMPGGGFGGTPCAHTLPCMNAEMHAQACAPHVLAGCLEALPAPCQDLGCFRAGNQVALCPSWGWKPARKQHQQDTRSSGTLASCGHASCWDTPKYPCYGASSLPLLSERISCPLCRRVGISLSRALAALQALPFPSHLLFRSILAESREVAPSLHPLGPQCPSKAALVWRT